MTISMLRRKTGSTTANTQNVKIGLLFYRKHYSGKSHTSNYLNSPSDLITGNICGHTSSLSNVPDALTLQQNKRMFVDMLNERTTHGLKNGGG